ncbi:MAG TPA: hypothetical protein VFV67_22555 [Actinophytocola sp.]|uniref:CBU_0592 family membrane protein n=1 Tax=Actinophytocola sp. TaxID=1872138 RepID=UPI002DB7B947|nr:hypothetical protein [Actinophytocola sp.]HEU5473435.1 hypothetical protein [Actinophytocola sp.]
MGQLVQIAGSLLVLGGFTLAQLGKLDPKSRSYLVLNAVGSGVLAVDALLGELWGFLLLEGVWAVVSVVALGSVLLPNRSARWTSAQ